MFDFHEKRKIRKVLYSKVVFIILLFIAVLLSTSAYSRFIVAQQTKERLEDRRIDLKALETRAEVLGSKVEHLENERGIEEELRNRFDVAKEGEQVVIILEDRDVREEIEKNIKDEASFKTESGIKSFMNLFKFW